MRIRRRLAGAAAVAVVLGITTAGWRASGETDLAMPAPVDVGSAGVGETLLLVVADVVAHAESTEKLASLNEHFGDTQGFYADATKAYDVTGALVQTSPDFANVSCDEALGTLASPRSDHGSTTDCSALPSAVRALLPISTTLVPSDVLTTYLSTTPCGTAASPPCVAERFNELLGDDLELEPGKVVITTAFRTKRGAEEFLDLARAVGLTGLITVQAKKLSGGDVGLGQEPHPDGSGPLTGPLPEQEYHQR